MAEPIQVQNSAQSNRLPIIVFVDDEEAILASLRSLFRRTRYSTSVFTSAGPAIEFVKRVPADLVISDLRMPVITGIEFLNQVSAINPHAVRVILSGYEDKTIVMNALSKGLAHHYMLKPWNDAELRQLVEQSLERLESLRRQRLEGILRSIETLPSPPTFHVQIQTVLAREGSSVYDIAREVEKSPPIVAKLLRVSNSIYFASRKAITSVRDAVFFIGTEYIAGLVAAIEAFHSFPLQDDAEVVQEIQSLWLSSFRRAMIAKKIAEKWPGFTELDTAFVASLLQDIGYAVFMCFEHEAYLEYKAAVAEPGANPLREEEKIFVHTHPTVGAALIEYWNLPVPVVQAVSRQHHMSETDPLVQILQLADLLCNGDAVVQHDPVVDRMLPSWRDTLHDELEPTH
jgi:HD-like signal output (HDOD) protein/CheY-like chemotaxis protein